MIRSPESKLMDLYGYPAFGWRRNAIKHLRQLSEDHSLKYTRIKDLVDVILDESTTRDEAYAAILVGVIV
jgi:hypothetical protein